MNRAVRRPSPTADSRTPSHPWRSRNLPRRRRSMPTGSRPSRCALVSRCRHGCRHSSRRRSKSSSIPSVTSAGAVQIPRWAVAATTADLADRRWAEARSRSTLQASAGSRSCSRAGACSSSRSSRRARGLRRACRGRSQGGAQASVSVDVPRLLRALGSCVSCVCSRRACAAAPLSPPRPGRRSR